MLGITTFIAGLLGVPAPNGLIPQAPLHTASLVVTGYEATSDTSSETVVPEDNQDVEGSHGEKLRKRDKMSRKVKDLASQEGIEARTRRADNMKGKREVPVAVVEQRVSNLVQGALCE